VTGVGYFLPELLLHSRGQERSQQISLELADTLDQMTIAVEAGLGFDSAMARAGKNGTGPLAEELVRTLQDIQVGRSRREAYGALAERTAVPDLRRFVRAVIQADTYGIAVADVLRTQAGEMRLKRRQRAEEKAMQIPVKVIFPLMICILPVLFIVLLGPAVMDIVAVLG
jgi:tight adherence protein C